MEQKCTQNFVLCLIQNFQVNVMLLWYFFRGITYTKDICVIRKVIGLTVQDGVVEIEYVNKE